MMTNTETRESQRERARERARERPPTHIERAFYLLYFPFNGYSSENLKQVCWAGKRCRLSETRFFNDEECSSTGV